MKKCLFLFIFIGLLMQGSPGMSAETSASAPGGEPGLLKESSRENRERKTVLRESEILGTLEKPRLSTEIPWHNPENLPEEITGPRKSFIREIFRPVPPGPSLETTH